MKDFKTLTATPIVALNFDFVKEGTFSLTISGLPITEEPQTNALCSVLVIHDTIEEWANDVLSDMTNGRGGLCQIAEKIRAHLQVENKFVRSITPPAGGVH